MKTYRFKLNRQLVHQVQFAHRILLSVGLSLMLAHCGEADTQTPATTVSSKTTLAQQSPEPDNSFEAPAATTSFTIDNTRYFFDVSNHTVDELHALLERIEEITEASPETFDQLEIVMVLHGPDINLFTEKNYRQNEKLITLAAKLDAFKVVDMKACETAMNSLGIDQSEIPPFIETVPYAPAEIQRLQEQGYINL